MIAFQLEPVFDSPVVGALEYGFFDTPSDQEHGMVELFRTAEHWIEHALAVKL